MKEYDHVRKLHFKDGLSYRQVAEKLKIARQTVKKMIENEDSAKPLTDDQITKRLNEMGIRVTRRTVAKYREDMRIPSTYQRRVKA